MVVEDVPVAPADDERLFRLLVRRLVLPVVPVPMRSFVPILESVVGIVVPAFIAPVPVEYVPFDCIPVVLLFIVPVFGFGVVVVPVVVVVPLLFIVPELVAGGWVWYVPDFVPVLVPLFIVPVVVVPVVPTPVGFLVCAVALKVTPARSIMPKIINFFIVEIVPVAKRCLQR